MKIDYEITVDVRGMSVKKKRKVQDAFLKLGLASADVTAESFESCSFMANYYRGLRQRVWCLMGDYKPTHTYAQLMELANMTYKKQLTDLNSDELRTKLAKNTGKMTKLKLQNDEIVELLRIRALAPIDVDDKVALTVDELKAGGWWCGDTSEACRLALESFGFKFFSCIWDSEFDACFADILEDTIGRGPEIHATSTLKLKQIQRIGNEFYWSEV